MKYKLVYDLHGGLVCYGPNTDSYDPMLTQGQSIVLSDVLPIPTFEQRKKELEVAVQNFMDAEARRLGYDSLLSACSYASTPNPFQTEGTSFLTWRSACWNYCYALLAQVVAGTTVEPTATQLIAQLPVRV